MSRSVMAFSRMLKIRENGSAFRFDRRTATATATRNILSGLRFVSTQADSQGSDASSPTTPAWAKTIFGGSFDSNPKMYRAVLVVGGAGALGRDAVREFKNSKYFTISVDVNRCSDADHNILVKGASLDQDISAVEKELKTMKADAFDAVFCAAGGWEGGSIVSDNIGACLDKMMRLNLNPSVLSGNIACKHLKDAGVLMLTGALPALKPTPNMLGYGLSKAAVLTLIQNLALDNRFTTVGILPETLDTPANRKAMPDADTRSWTPTADLAERLVYIVESEVYKKWNSGMLVSVETIDNDTLLLDARMHTELPR